MKTAFVLSVVVGATLLSVAAQAKDVSEAATVVAMNSVPCGTKGEPREKKGPLCHEYVLRSGLTEYHVQQKEEKKGALLATGQQVTFTIHKDRIRIHANDTSGKAKDFEFVLVLMTTVEEANPPSTPPQ
jgi:hypothetical protein